MSPLAPTHATLTGLAVLIALATFGCSGGEVPVMARAGQSSFVGGADAVHVAAGEEGDYLDLPGVVGFDTLSEAMRLEVLDRANITRCSCGCARHTVAACLHQEERCDVALDLVTGFVDDALTFMQETGGKAAPAGDPPPEDGGAVLDTETRPDAVPPANEPD